MLQNPDDCDLETEEQTPTIVSPILLNVLPTSPFQEQGSKSLDECIVHYSMVWIGATVVCSIMYECKGYPHCKTQVRKLPHHFRSHSNSCSLRFSQAGNYQMSSVLNKIEISQWGDEIQQDLLHRDSKAVHYWVAECKRYPS